MTRAVVGDHVAQSVLCTYFLHTNIIISIAVFLVTGAMGSISLVRSGWLDRVVKYHKQNLYKDMMKVSPIQINVTMEPIPSGYVDSDLWTYDSVVQLLILIRESKSAAPVRKTLRRMMSPRRRFMSKAKSFKVFPSLSKNYSRWNEFYYDIPSSEEYIEPEAFGGVPDDDAVITVSNPVEARLPSARISIKLLREIMDARAAAARAMPPTAASTFFWKPMNKTTVKTTAGTSKPAGDGKADAAEKAAEGSISEKDAGGGVTSGAQGGTETAQQAVETTQAHTAPE